MVMGSWQGFFFGDGFCGSAFGAGVEAASVLGEELSWWTCTAVLGL